MPRGVSLKVIKTFIYVSSDIKRNYHCILLYCYVIIVMLYCYAGIVTVRHVYAGLIACCMPVCYAFFHRGGD